MSSVEQIELAWKLYQSHVDTDTIAANLNKHRSTLFRWFRGIKLSGIQEYIRRYKQAKKRKRIKRIDYRVEPLVVQRRKDKTGQCGQKIKHWLKRVHNIVVSLATIYRILGKHFKLHSKWKKWVRRPPLPQAQAPREVIQGDNIDLGELFVHSFIDTYTKEVVSLVVDTLDARQAVQSLEQAMNYFKGSVWIQTDNGAEYKKEFRPTAKKYCQRLRQITPYQKEENGFIESFNRTLRKECVGWRKYQRQDKQKLQAYINAYLEEYHNERYHLSLNLMTPYEFIQSLTTKNQLSKSRI